MSDIIERFSAKNYGCLKDVSVALTPLHAFIGPNDSGKSTILRGIRTLLQYAGEEFQLDEQGAPQPFDPGIGAQELLDPSLRLEMSLGALTYRICDAGSVTEHTDPEKDLIDVYDVYDVDEEILVGGERFSSKRRKMLRAGQKATHHVSDLRARHAGIPAEVTSAGLLFMRSARMLRLDPDSLRRPSKLLTSSRIDFEDDQGHGLPGIYDVILNQHLEGFLKIQGSLRELFPSVRSLGLQNMSESTKELRIQLTSGEWVPARFMSEGMLYYLAFAAIQYLSPTAVLLVEEPENGLHPARIVEVIQVLREISKTTQVLLATHSPLVINELQPEEVSVVTRNPETGTKVTPMTETANFAKRSSVYALGELWLSFADGKEEAPLLEGRGAS